MIVTIVCDVFGKENNGTVIASMNLIRSLKSKGYTVRILCADPTKKGMEGYYVVPTYHFGPIIDAYVKKNGVTIAHPVRQVVVDAIKDCDIVHIMMPMPLGKKAMQVAKEFNKPITAGFHEQAENLTNHIFLMNSKFANNETYRRFYKYLYKYVDAIHYPTKFIREVFEGVVGPTNGYVISNGISSDFHPQEIEKPANLVGKYTILFSGRLSKEKSHKVLIDAVAKSKYKDLIQLIFAGTGPTESSLKRRAWLRGLKNKPIINFYSRQDLLQVINSADLYVHPAEIEIEAISCLEAIACGIVPVIANSPRSATRFFALDDNNLFDYNNSKDLAKKIDFWIENEKLKQDYKKRYEEYIKQFDRTYCMDNMEKMILDAYEKHTSNK